MLSHYATNKMQDWFYRGQTWSLPANFYIALCTTTCTQAAMGTEVTGGSYARIALPRTLTDISGTQGQGTTVASSGTSGTIYNNNAIAMGTPTVAWGTVQSAVLMDAVTGGNMLEYYNFPTPKQIVNVGDPVELPQFFFVSTLTSS